MAGTQYKPLSVSGISRLIPSFDEEGIGRDFRYGFRSETYVLSLVCKPLVGCKRHCKRRNDLKTLARKYQSAIFDAVISRRINGRLCFVPRSVYVEDLQLPQSRNGKIDGEVLQRNVLSVQQCKRDHPTVKNKFGTLSVERNILQMFKREPHPLGIVLIVIRDIILAYESAVLVEMIRSGRECNGQMSRIGTRLQVSNQFGGCIRCVVLCVGQDPETIERDDGRLLLCTAGMAQKQSQQEYLCFFHPILFYLVSKRRDCTNPRFVKPLPDHSENKGRLFIEKINHSYPD